MMGDNKLRIALDLIQVLLDLLDKSVSDVNHIEKLETIEDGKLVLAELKNK